MTPTESSQPQLPVYRFSWYWQINLSDWLHLAALLRGGYHRISNFRDCFKIFWQIEGNLSNTCYLKQEMTLNCYENRIQSLTVTISDIDKSQIQKLWEIASILHANIQNDQYASCSADIVAVHEEQPHDVVCVHRVQAHSDFVVIQSQH